MTQRLHQLTLNQSQMNNTLGSILNNQQSLQRETISMMNECPRDMKMNSSFGHSNVQWKEHRF